MNCFDINQFRVEPLRVVPVYGILGPGTDMANYCEYRHHFTDRAGGVHRDSVTDGQQTVSTHTTLTHH